MGASPAAIGTLAASDGTLVQVQFDSEKDADGGMRLLHRINLSPPEMTGPPSIITMDCDVSPDGTRLAAALSSGRVIAVDAASGGGGGQLGGGQHDLEAWTVCFDTHQAGNQLLHSGGDDARWRGWDLRCLPSQPAFTVGWHSAGVCSIQPHPLHPFAIVTGSYDRRLALWDRRRLGRPVQALEPAAASGVWKLRWHPTDSDRLLAACMYDGFYIYQIPGLLFGGGEAEEPQGQVTTTQRESCPTRGMAVRTRYDPGALSYGCAWLDDCTAVTCSFYNRQLQIWSSPRPASRLDGLPTHHHDQPF